MSVMAIKICSIVLYFAKKSVLLLNFECFSSCLNVFMGDNRLNKVKVIDGTLITIN